MGFVVPRVARADDEPRLRSIVEVLESEEAPARRWWWGWLGGFTVATAVQAFVAFRTDDDAIRAETRVGAVTSAIGALDTLIAPFPVPGAASRLRALPDGTGEERREKLRLAEEELRACADAERHGRSWFPHVGAVLVNGAAGVFLWRHDDLPLEGLGAFVIGMLVAEAKIFSQPTAARDAYDRGDGPSISLAAWPGGAALVGRL
jgi:hypothetical protein